VESHGLTRRRGKLGGREEGRSYAQGSSVIDSIILKEGKVLENRDRCPSSTNIIQKTGAQRYEKGKGKEGTPELVILKKKKKK